MTAFCHSRSHGCRKADGTVGTLGQGGREDLEDMVPRQMDVRVDALSFVVAMRIDNEAIIGVHIAAAHQCLPGLVEYLHRNSLTELCRQHGNQSPAPKLEISVGSVDGSRRRHVGVGLYNPN